MIFGAIAMSNLASAMSVESKEFPLCSLLEGDADFLLNITRCDEQAIVGTLTFNETSAKSQLTGWFNVSGDYNSAGQFTIRSNRRSIPFALYLADFGLNMSNINLTLKWGLNSSTVSVTTNGVYRINGNGGTYSLDLGRTSCSATAPCGAEANMTIYGTNMPIYASQSKNLRAVLSGETRSMDFANSSLIESGPVRVMIRADNLTNNFNMSTTFFNWTQSVFAYPTYYQNVYYITANGTLAIGSNTVEAFHVYKTTQTANNNPRFDEWNNRTINGTNYLFSVDVGTGSDSYIMGSSTLSFLYDDADHNKTFTFFKTQTNLTGTATSKIYQDTSERITTGFYTSNHAAGTYYLGYGVMFGQNGGVAVESNQSVWDADFEEQYRAWYNPATMTASVGTQQGRSNITGAYNYTANGTMADFNFTTVALMNYTYPVFEIRNLSNVSAIKVFWKNYTASASWSELTNYTDYVLQEGNATWMGYDYVLLLINKTLGREAVNGAIYEFMVNNTTAGGGEPPEDPCEYSSGDWLIDCANKCNATATNVTGALRIYSTAAGYVNLTGVNATLLVENYTHSCYVIRRNLVVK